MATSGTLATTIPATTATTERALCTPTPAPTPTSSPASAPPIPAQLRPADTSTADTEAGASNGGDGTSSGIPKPTVARAPPVEAPPAREPKAPDAAEDAPGASGDGGSPVTSTVRSQPLALVPHSAPASVEPVSSVPAASTSTHADAPSPTTRMLDLGLWDVAGFSRQLSRRGLDADSFVVGVPAHAAAYRPDTHVQDGYGGVENLLVFDGLSNQDLDDLEQIVGSQSEVRSMVLRPFPGPDDQPLENFDPFLDSLLVRRQMASVFRQFEGECFAERLFYSISLLHRVLGHHRSSVSMRTSAGLSVQDTALRSKYDSLARDYGFLEAYHEQERKSLQDTVEDVKSELDRELSVAADEQAVHETRLTDQVQKLEARLASATQTIPRLEKAKQAKGFDADKLMTFLHENQGSIRGLAADKPYHAMPPFPNAPDRDSETSDDEEIVVSDGDDAPDQESKSEEKPPASSLPLETPVPDVAPTEKSPSGASARKRPPKQSHRSSKTMKLVEMETSHGTVRIQSRPTVHLESVKRPLRFITAQKMSVEEVVSRFPDFLTLADLRLDTLTMQAGFGYSLAVKMMGDDAVAHHEFPEADLCNMLTQMMYHRCLDETLWTPCVPDKYFRTAEIALKARVLVGNYPSEWPKLCNVRDDSLSAHKTIEIEESEEEDDPADEDYISKDEAEAQPVNDGGALSNDETETASDRAREKYPGIFSSSDESSENEATKSKPRSRRGSLSPRESPAKNIPTTKSGKKATSQSKAHLKRKRHSSGSSSESDSGGKGSTYTPSSKRPRPRRSNGRSKSRLAQLKYDELSDVDKAVIERSGRVVISWRRRRILCRFSPKKDGTDGQTPGFPDYAPQLSDIVFLKRRWIPMLKQYLPLMSKRPWKVMLANREKYLYFHLRSDFSPTAVKA
ncbi:hypothetical protein PHMEG_00028922, partial [Phytophthora megakarya]